MDPKKFAKNCKKIANNCTSFSIIPENCEILTSFFPPDKIAGNIVSFCSYNKFGKNFTSFSYHTKLTKICPHKFEKILQVFVRGTNRENFYKFLSLRQY